MSACWINTFYSVLCAVLGLHIHRDDIIFLKYQLATDSDIINTLMC